MSQTTPRLFASTRGKIVTLFRGASRTVEELAEALDLTDNAVRAQLAALERDGWVQQSGKRRSSSKPASLYTLTPAAEELFPKAYGPVLRQLLEELTQRLTVEDVEEILRSTGRRLAVQWSLPRGELHARVEAAVFVLNALGGQAELERRNGTYSIRGYSCPLAAAVPGHPEVCRLAETLLTSLVDAPVQERCEYGETLRSHFILSVT